MKSADPYRRWKIWFLIFASLAFGLALAFKPGIHVTVTNSGNETIRGAIIHVTGRSYSLGDLAPGERSSRTVNPTSESHLEVEFVDDQGQPIRLDAGGYFEPGYRGKFNIKIRDGKIASSRDETRVNLY